MSELYKYNRLKFYKKGQQRNFILNSKEILNITWVVFAKKLKITQRTLNDWTREKYNISQIGAEKISKLTKKPIPQTYKIIDWKLHLQNAGKVGGKQKLLKYGNVGGDEERRKIAWKNWWEKTGKYKEKPKGFQSLIKIRIPKKNKPLAEFVGIMLGDGGVAPYHITITLSNKEEKYVHYVINLTKKLFGLVPKIHKVKNANAINIVIQRKQIVDFCQNIGLVLGDKVRQQADVPFWIKENEIFRKECLRGLIDTDGSFFNNSYDVRSKKYSYIKIAFTNSSLPLILFVYESLNRIGIRSSVQRDRKEVRISERESVLKYIEKVGTNNFKHLEKIRKWKNINNMIK